MTPTKTLYQANHEAMLLPRDVKLILRIRQIANQNTGTVVLTIVINEDGTYSLMPLPPAERIG